MSSQVTFFQQGTIPCVSHDGRFIMETPYKVPLVSVYLREINLECNVMASIHYTKWVELATIPDCGSL